MLVSLISEDFSLKTSSHLISHKENDKCLLNTTKIDITNYVIALTIMNNVAIVTGLINKLLIVDAPPESN